MSEDDISRSKGGWLFLNVYCYPEDGCVVAMPVTTLSETGLKVGNCVWVCHKNKKIKAEIVHPTDELIDWTSSENWIAISQSMIDKFELPKLGEKPKSEAIQKYHAVSIKALGVLDKIHQYFEKKRPKKITITEVYQTAEEIKIYEHDGGDVILPNAIRSALKVSAGSMIGVSDKNEEKHDYAKVEAATPELLEHIGKQDNDYFIMLDHWVIEKLGLKEENKTKNTPKYLSRYTPVRIWRK